MSAKSVIAVITFDDTENNITSLADAATWIQCALSPSTLMACDVTTYSTAADATHHIDDFGATPLPSNAPEEPDQFSAMRSALDTCLHALNSAPRFTFDPVENPLTLPVNRQARASSYDLAARIQSVVSATTPPAKPPIQSHSAGGFIALVGNLSDGYSAHGPFPHFEAADAYTSKGFASAPSWIMTLSPTNSTYHEPDPPEVIELTLAESLPLEDLTGLPAPLKEAISDARRDVSADFAGNPQASVIITIIR